MNRSVGRASALLELSQPSSILLYSYYAFIFAIPYETLGFEAFSLSKFFGYLLVVLAISQPRVCFRRRPKALWYFLIYLCGYAILGLLQETEYVNASASHLFTMVQLVVLFWISYNLLQNERVCKGTLLTLAVSCFSLAVLNALEITSRELGSRTLRISTLGEDPNSSAAVLSLGLLAFLGLAYGRRKTDKKVRFFVGFVFIFLAASIIQTGSRGALIALLTGLLILGLKRGTLVVKLKVGMAVSLAIVILIGFSYQYEPVRERWEQTLTEGNLSSRDEIFLLSWGMFLEKPLFGWGPEKFYYELGYRYNSPKGRKGPHNSYLYVLLATGLVGAIFFFMGMWDCTRAAWKARKGPQNVLPIAMLSCVLIVDLSLVWHSTKLHWVVLAYALASASQVVSERYHRGRLPLRYRRRMPSYSCTS